MNSPVKSVAFSGSRTAIERCQNRPMQGPSVIESAIATAVTAHPSLPGAVKNGILART